MCCCNESGLSVPHYSDDCTTQKINHEDYQMICEENKNMAKALKKLGYTKDQISDICNGAI